MIQHQPVTQLPNAVFEKLGWEYFVSEEAKDYLTNQLVVVEKAESDAYYETANRLYERFVEAGEYVLRHNLLDTLGVPRNLHEMIRATWEDDRQMHLFGRFDFAGGTSGLPIKMLEFNADTPTSLPETAMIQWGQLQANGIPDDQQFNFVYEALTDNFRRLRALNPEREPVMLFSTIEGAPEDDNNVALLREAAREAGFETAFRYIHEVVFSPTEGIFAPLANGQHRSFPFWFKLVPWEYIGQHEPELCEILTRIVRRDAALILNPPYTMLFQSKGILKYLWDLFPNDPAILESSFEEPIGRSDYPFVQKVFLGREGSNVSIHDEIGLPTEVRKGEYEKQPSIYQALARLDQDADGYYYQAGVFFAYEACGLGFRRSSRRIIDNGAQFVGHKINC